MRNLLAGTVVLACAGTTLAIDGANIPADFGAPKLLSTQTNCSGYGDSVGFGIGGSEADALYVDNDATTLKLGIPANLEWNGNALIILIDTEPADGQDPLFTTGAGGPPYAVDGLHDSTMDPGFAPDYIVAVDIFGGDVYVNYYVLDSGLPAVRTYLGSVGGGSGTGVGSGSGVLSGGSISTSVEVAFDDSNSAGVKGCPDTSGDPATATTGCEALIPLADIGSPELGCDIKVWVLLSSGSGDGYFSNQSLPPFTPDPGNSSPYDINGDGTADNQPGFDFSVNYGGQQWAAYKLSGGSKGDCNCDGTVDSFDIAAFTLALTNPTQFALDYPGCDINNADGNCDGVIDSFDIAAFVAILTGG